MKPIDTFTCVISDNDQVEFFGYERLGELGCRDSNNRNIPVETINLSNAANGTPYRVFSP